MNNNGHTNIMGYSNSNWTRNALNHRQLLIIACLLIVTYFCIKIKKQQMVTRSCSKVEYRVIASTTYELG